MFGIPVEVNVTPAGYRIIEDERLIHDTRRVLNPKWITSTMGHIKMSNEGKFSQMWKNGGNILVGTDGGLKCNIGTSGVYMEMEEDTAVHYTSISAEVCNHGALHSTREELRAIMSAELLLEKFSKRSGQYDRRVTFVCDSKSALGEVDKPKSD